MAKARRSSRRALSVFSISRPVSRVLYGGVAPTWQPFLWDASCDAPQAANPDDWSEENRLSPRHPYLALLPVGFAVPPPLPDARCALTAPFHPYLIRRSGGLFSVALSLGSPPPDVIRHRFSVEPGLSSKLIAPRLPGRLTKSRWAAARMRSRKMARTFPSAPEHREQKPVDA